ncbi:MAG: EpsI family protein [Bryobacteraceae bacterium]|nr:EpsI family protein [Bryobacteraceae bacterium]
MKFSLTRAGQILSAILIGQAALFYGLSRAEYVPPSQPLTNMSKTLGSWKMVQEGVVEKEVQDVLKADDTLTRGFVSDKFPVSAGLFIAAFRSQRSGKAPHSPKNCLPGSGWTETEQGFASLKLDGRADPIVVNKYVVQKGESTSLVIYWYQSRDRVVASEYSAKGYVVLDAIRDNRTDSALVRVIVPVVNNNVDQAMVVATDFIQASFDKIRRQLPA